MVFVLAVACGGTTFNILSVALPKIIDERLGLSLPLWLIGSLSTFVLLFGALTQLNVGRIIEKQPLPRLFAIIALFQPVGLLLATFTTGIPLLLGLLFSIAAIYGNVVVTDAMIARYVPDEHRSRVYGIRYFVGFAVPALAVQMIGWLHNMGGFPLVLGVASIFGVALFASASVVWRLMSSPATPEAATA
jgi:MFS family permease